MLGAMSPTLRVALSGASFSAWMVLLLSGHRFGGAIAVFGLAALLLFPWRAARAKGSASASADSSANEEPPH